MLYILIHVIQTEPILEVQNSKIGQFKEKDQDVKDEMSSRYVVRREKYIPSIPMRWHRFIGYQTMGLLPIGIIALGKSSGFDAKVVKETPGPHKIKACSPFFGTEVGMFPVITVA